MGQHISKPFDINKSTLGREQKLKEQFAASRRRLGGQRSETERQSKRGFERLAATTGQTGGAIQKAKQQATRQIGQTFGDVEAGLAGQEAGAIERVRGEGQAQQLQQNQFAQTLQFQQNSFDKQLAFKWAEFDENVKTNLLNSFIAIEESSIDSNDTLNRMREFLERINFNPSTTPKGPVDPGSLAGNLGVR